MLHHLLTFRSFGFIKYHNFDDAENCIRGFHWLGYEVSFARVGVYQLPRRLLMTLLTLYSGIFLRQAQEVL